MSRRTENRAQLFVQPVDLLFDRGGTSKFTGGKVVYIHAASKYSKPVKSQDRNVLTQETSVGLQFIIRGFSKLRQPVSSSRPATLIRQSVVSQADLSSTDEKRLRR